MRNWLATVNIKQHMTEEEDIDSTLKTAANIRQQLAYSMNELKEAGAWTYDVEDCIEDLTSINDLEDVNDILERLYDWADDNSVWLGLA